MGKALSTHLGIFCRIDTTSMTTVCTTQRRGTGILLIHGGLHCTETPDTLETVQIVRQAVRSEGRLPQGGGTGTHSA